MKKNGTNMGKKYNDQQLTFWNCQDKILVKPNIDIRITSNILIIISPLGLTYVSEKQITFEELDWIQQVCKQHSTDHYMLTPEVIDKLGIKFDSSTIKEYAPLKYQDIRSFIRCVLPSGNWQISNNIARWIIDKHRKSKPISYKKIYLQETHGITRNSNIKYIELVQHIYIAIVTGVCKASLQRKNKPGRNSTCISDLSIDN